MKARLATVLVATSAVLCGGERGFDHMVRAIEAHYGIQQTHIPLMGVANFALKVAHPAGTSGFRLALFENIQSCERCFEREDLDRFIEEAAAGELHPLVRTYTRNESTYILTGPVGKSTKMLIATFDNSQATIVEVTVDLKTLMRTINSPGRAGDWVDDSHDY